MLKFFVFAILFTIIMFFVWNSLKRIFFTKFYQGFPHQEEKKTTPKKKKNLDEKKVKWDAETVEYEEIKEE